MMENPNVLGGYEVGDGVLPMDGQYYMMEGLAEPAAMLPVAESRFVLNTEVGDLSVSAKLWLQFLL